jgi:hypothetical protein
VIRISSHCQRPGPGAHDGGPSDFAFLDPSDNKLYGRDTAISAVGALVWQGDELMYRAVTYTEPYTWWRYNPSRIGQPIEATPLAGASPVEFGDVEACVKWCCRRMARRSR